MSAHTSRNNPASGGRIDAMSTGAGYSVPRHHARDLAGATWGKEVRDWVVQHAVSLVLMGALLGIVGLVHGVGMFDWPQNPIGDDEGTYMAQAWSVQNWSELAHYTYWYDHPPLGWLTIAGWTWMTGAFDWAPSAIGAGRSFMLVLDLISCALVFGIARRLGMKRIFASVAVLLFGLSPLAIDYHRIVALDNVAMVWVLAAFFVALSRSRGLWPFAAAGAFLALGAISKETMVLFLPALAIISWQRAPRSTRRFCLTMFGAFFLLFAAPYFLLALLKGELFPGSGHVSLLQSLGWQVTGRGSSSVFDSSSYSRVTLDAWLSGDAWLLIGGTIIAPFMLLSSRFKAISIAFLVFVAMILRPGYLPVPLVIAMIPMAALLIAGAGDSIWDRQRGAQAVGSARSRGALSGIGAPIVVIAGVVLAATMIPTWIRKDRDRMTQNIVAPITNSVDWITANVPHNAKMLVDDTIWIELVRNGFDPKNLVWDWKIEHDPVVEARFPNGWKDFDYLVSSDTNRLQPLVNAEAALVNSTVVQRFGEGRQRVELRKIVLPTT